MPTTPIWTILEWFLYGAVRWVLYWIPLVTPFSVDRSVPWQWYRYNDGYDWSHRNDNNGGPDEHWLNSWFEMALGELKVLILEESKPYVNAVRDAWRSLLGSVWGAFPSMGAWVQHVQLMIGLTIPPWTANVVSGLGWLRGTFPLVVREGWASWDELWEGIKSSVRNWAISRYDQARAWASDNLWWVANVGESLRSWRDSVAAWIQGVRSNPWGWVLSVIGPGLPWLLEFQRDARAWVISWLGPEWTELVSFRNGPLRFYYNLWSRGWESLAQLIEDPGEWLRSRLEAALLDRW